MKWFVNLNISKKIFMIFSGINFALLGLGLLALYEINALNSIANDINKVWLPKVTNILELNVHRSRHRVRELDHLLSTDQADMLKYEKEIEEKIQPKMNEVLTAYEKLVTLPEEKAKVKELEVALKIYMTESSKILALSRLNKNDLALNLSRGESKKNLDKARDILFELRDLDVNRINEIVQVAESMHSFSFKIVIFILIATMCITVILGRMLNDSISKPVIKLTEVAEKIALGEARMDIHYAGKDEIGKLINSFKKMVTSINETSASVQKMSQGDFTVKMKVRSDEDILGISLSHMIVNLNSILQEINSAATQLHLNARYVSDGSQSLAQGTTEQAGSIEQMSVALNLLTVRTKANSQNAENVKSLVFSTKQKALEGDNQMQSMLKAMDEINQSSNSIARIIRVIDSIAFQTNILALNAAVEAAKAGQHGKGFAVVAEEVRNLAARSAEAAKETSILIENSLIKVNNGKDLAGLTANALGKIVEYISDVSSRIEEMTVSSNDQATSINEINTGVNQMAQVTSSNASIAEESAAASEELSGQAESFKDIVSRFKLQDSAHSVEDSRELEVKPTRPPRTRDVNIVL